MMNRPAALRARLAVLRERGPALVLILLLATDAVLILMHIAQKTVGIPPTATYDLGVDRSYAGMLLLMKWGWIGVLCAVAWRSSRAPLMLSVAIVCAVLLVEDGLSIHERVGVALEPTVQALFRSSLDHLVALQVGELVWYAVIVMIVVTVVAIGWARSDRSARADTGVLAVFFLAFAFCAVVLDSIHSLFPHGTAIDTVLTILEDGGELVSMSPAVAFAFALATRAREQAPSRTPGERSPRPVEAHDSGSPTPRG